MSADRRSNQKGLVSEADSAAKEEVQSNHLNSFSIRNASVAQVVSNVAQVRKYQEVHWKFISDHAKEFVLNISI